MWRIIAVSIEDTISLYPAKPNENKPVEQLNNKGLLDIVLYKILHIYDSPIPALQDLIVFHPCSYTCLN